MNGGLSSAATTASSNVSVTSSSPGEVSASSTAISGSATAARQSFYRRNLTDFPPSEQESARESYSERELQGNMLRDQEPRILADDHYEPFIYGTSPSYNMLFPHLLSPALRVTRPTPPGGVRDRSRSRSPAYERQRERDGGRGMATDDLERGMEQTRDREVNNNDSIIINREIERLRERNESLRSTFGSGSGSSGSSDWSVRVSGGRRGGWGGTLFPRNREAEVEEQPSGSGSGHSPGHWGRIYSTRNPNLEGRMEEQSSYVRESARRAARFMESMRAHVRGFGGGPVSEPVPDVNGGRRGGGDGVDGLGDRERSLR